MKTELELRQLRVFLAVLDSGAHTRAAKLLGISQSTVSETLSSLERVVGTPVFHKSTKGSILTSAGEALVPHARRMLALSDEFAVAIATIMRKANTRLTLSAVESLTTYVLPEPLAALRERWPETHIEVMTATCAEIREAIAAGRSDLGLTIEVDECIDREAVLATARLLVVAPPSHPLAERSASAEVLRNHDLYISGIVGDYHRVLKQYFDTKGAPLPKLVMTGTVEGVKQGVLAGGTSLALLPAHAVHKELQAGQLARINLQPPLPLLVVRAIRAAHSARSPLIDDFLQFLNDTRSLDWLPRLPPKDPVG